MKIALLTLVVAVAAFAVVARFGYSSTPAAEARVIRLNDRDVRTQPTPSKSPSPSPSISEVEREIDDDLYDDDDSGRDSGSGHSGSDCSGSSCSGDSDGDRD